MSLFLKLPLLPYPPLLLRLHLAIAPPPSILVAFNLFYGDVAPMPPGTSEHPGIEDGLQRSTAFLTDPTSNPSSASEVIESLLFGISGHSRYTLHSPLDIRRQR